MPPRHEQSTEHLIPSALHTLSGSAGLVSSDISARSRPQKPGKKAHLNQPPAPRSWKVRIEIYPRDVKVHQAGRRPVPPPVPPAADDVPIPVKGKKQNITCLSDKSRRALVLEARNVTGLTHMITLTYPSDFPTDGRTVKEHLRRFRQFLTRRGIGGMWVMEFQQRGAPHYHLWVTGSVDKRDLSEAWYNIVQSGDERHLKAGTQIVRLKKEHALSSYAAKYGAKMSQKGVPEGYTDCGRFWGQFGGVKAEAVEVIMGTLHDLAPVVRAARRAETAKRRKANLKPRKDRGKNGRTFYDAAKALTPRVLDALLPEPHFYTRTSKNIVPNADAADNAALVEQHFKLEEPPPVTKRNVVRCYVKEAVRQGREHALLPRSRRVVVGEHRVEPRLGRGEPARR